MREREYSRGGYIPGPTVTVKARKVGEHVEYWEPCMGAWVRVITTAEIKRFATRGNTPCGTVDNSAQPL